MAHKQQQEFFALVKKAFPQFFSNVKVLEIGSLDINGSVRTQFCDVEYTGVDVGEGPGVDVVCEGQDYGAASGSYDVVLSAECMEHNPHYLATFHNMIRLCRPGGLVIMTCATYGRPEHGTRRTTPEDAPLIQWDYYKNLIAKDFDRDGALKERVWPLTFCYDLSSRDLYFVGIRCGGTTPPNADVWLKAIRSKYRRKNLGQRYNLKEHFLCRIFGEQKYLSGSLLPWKRNSISAVRPEMRKKNKS